MSEEQGGFRKGRACIDQIFAMKRLVEEYLGKDKKLYAAFMDVEKAYDRCFFFLFCFFYVLALLHR